MSERNDRSNLLLTHVAVDSLNAPPNIEPSDEELSKIEEEYPNNADYNPDYTDLFGIYIHEISQIPLLTKEEELKLAKMIQEGKQALEKGLYENSQEEQKRQAFISEAKRAREQLAEANTRLVISVAKKYFGRNLEFSDLVQEGNIGLLRAVDKFDYTRNYRFSTYAIWWIRQSILRALHQKDRSIRIPHNIRDKLVKLRKTIVSLEQTYGRSPTDEELATACNTDLIELKNLLSYMQSIISLDAPIHKDDSNNSILGELITAKNTNPEKITGHSMLIEELNSALSILSERQREILLLRFGIQTKDTYEPSIVKPKTFKEIGEVLNLSGERIRQLYEFALCKLRKSPQTNKELVYYLNADED